jgi:hypothetical protein
MNYVAFAVAGVALVAVAVTVLALAVRGVRDDLANAEIGRVYNFDYLQPFAGESHRYRAKILDVYSLDDDGIRRLNRRSNYRRDELQTGAFQRSKHLVTAQTADGKIRNFYAERTVNCRRPLIWAS